MTKQNAVVRQAADIAEALDEHSLDAMEQIKKLIMTCGLKFANARVEETRGVIKNGGLDTDDGLRKRTPGGVFFKLCKNRLNKDERLTVFGYRQR